ncbi:hypothetical protein F4811DRAFT_445250 [Daldinia bambusicola]|nr:hypothetical protein F4811DRAFT_445250 [Daldinia bambusicola]
MHGTASGLLLPSTAGPIDVVTTFLLRQLIVVATDAVPVVRIPLMSRSQSEHLQRVAALSIDPNPCVDYLLGGRNPSSQLHGVLRTLHKYVCTHHISSRLSIVEKSHEFSTSRNCCSSAYVDWPERDPLWILFRKGGNGNVCWMRTYHSPFRDPMARTVLRWLGADGWSESQLKVIQLK